MIKVRYIGSDRSYLHVFVNDKSVGVFQDVGDGYLASNRRKPVPTLKEAIKQHLDSVMNRKLKEHAEIRKLLEQALSSQELEIIDGMKGEAE